MRYPSCQMPLPTYNRTNLIWTAAVGFVVTFVILLTCGRWGEKHPTYKNYSDSVLPLSPDNGVPLKGRKYLHIVYTIKKTNPFLKYSAAVVDFLMNAKDTGEYRNVEGGGLQDKVVFALQSALVTQHDTAIILWTDPSYFGEITQQVRQLGEQFACGTGTTIEVRLLVELQRKLDSSQDDVINGDHCTLPAAGGHQPYSSDLLRFLLLFFYGGIYVDADTVFLKDLAPFHGRSFALKWGGAQDGSVSSWYTFPHAGFNTAVMGLPARSPIPARIAKHECTPAAFHPYNISSKLGCADPDTECVGFAMMPTSLFDPRQSYPVGDHKFRNLAKAFPGSLRGFFDRPSTFKDINNVYPGAFVYHWHNNWKATEHPESVYSKLKDKLSRCPTTIY